MRNGSPALLTSTFQGQVEQSCPSCGIVPEAHCLQILVFYSLMLPTASCLSRLAWLPPLCLLSMDDYHLIVVPSRLWFCLRLWLPESSPLSVSLNVATLLSHLWSHPFPDSHSLAVTVDWTIWILLLPKCPRLDCLTWCTGLYLWLKFLILRTWRYKRNDCVCIFFLRWHNRNTTKIYYSLFLVQILFLVSSVNRQTVMSLHQINLYNLFNTQILVLNHRPIELESQI